jgi:hypothetical protein
VELHRPRPVPALGDGEGVAGGDVQTHRAAPFRSVVPSKA